MNTAKNGYMEQGYVSLKGIDSSQKGKEKKELQKKKQGVKKRGGFKMKKKRHITSACRGGGVFKVYKQKERPEAPPPPFCYSIRLFITQESAYRYPLTTPALFAFQPHQHYPLLTFLFVFFWVSVDARHCLQAPRTTIFVPVMVRSDDQGISAFSLRPSTC